MPQKLIINNIMLLCLKIIFMSNLFFRLKNQPRSHLSAAGL